MDPAQSCHLHVALARVARKHPLGRKLLVAPTMGGGRELLRRLALDTGGWVGFEVTTPRPLAMLLSRRPMSRAGLRTLDAFDERALVDEALDRALIGAAGIWLELSEGVGFRERVHDAVGALRLAGITPPMVERARLADTDKRAFLAGVLRRYERLLQERASVDTAGVLALAVEELEQEGADLSGLLGADAVLLQPGLGVRGFAGRLLAALARRGARVLETDQVVGRQVPEALLWSRGKIATAHSFLDGVAALPADLDRPRLEFFHAASILDELREVLRRVTEGGLRWDQVEVVTPDPAAYGSALHALSTELGVPVTYAVGLPVERTRVGRAVLAYLDWVSEGFQAPTIRRLLEAGDLRPPRSHPHIAAASLARRFRALRIGWGRRRYRTRIRDGLAACERLERGRTEPEDTFDRRRTRIRAEFAALRSILFPVLRETPNVPDRATETGVPVSPAELARGLRAFLRRVPRGKGPERAAREEVMRVLDRIEATLRRRTHFRGALAILRRHLEIRVRAEVPGAGDGAAAPWSSEGGHLHLSDLEHGAYCGREVVFFVGMDADRVPGQGGQDPLLLDADRRILGRALPTSSELLRERAFQLSALVARIRGRVTFSHAAWDAAEARTLGPSPFLLQALRLGRVDDTLTFEDLRAELGRVVCAVPAPGRAALDRADAWMGVLGDGPVMRSGLEAVRAAYPLLDAGLRARAARGGDPGPVHGVVRARPDELDPRRNERLILSSSRLEGLGRCPLAYLHRSVLGIHLPDDPELDPDSWLDARHRGGLLHRVFERAMRGAKEGGIRHADAAFEALALEELERAASELRDELPVPGEGTLRRELEGLRNDVLSFVHMIRERGAPWVRLELGFGLEDDEPVTLDVAGGAIQLRGMVDRIDDAGIDGIRVVDYKTGAARDFGGRGTFDGGRRLQHGLYAHAVEARLGAQVVTGEYHFPTLKGEHDVHRFPRSALGDVKAVVGSMLDGVSAGRFVPTDDSKDCRFCDFAEICRVGRGRFGKVDSPLSEWARERVGTGACGAVEHLARTRSF